MNPKNLTQGDCVQLLEEESLFQVIGVDSEHQKCWVREWPLAPSGSPVFEVSMKQVNKP